MCICTDFSKSDSFATADAVVVFSCPRRTCDYNNSTLIHLYFTSTTSDLSFCLVPKEPTKPATLLNRFCLTLRLIGSGLAGKKLLMHCPSMESLGRCRSLLCRHQRRADLRQPCVQFLVCLSFTASCSLFRSNSPCSIAIKVVSQVSQLAFACCETCFRSTPK